MVDRRRANAAWTVADEKGDVPTWERVQLAVLMDLRDELQALNRKLACDGQIHSTLLRIERLLKPRRVTAKQAARVLAKRARKRRTR
jgi:hypothetical protein